MQKMPPALTTEEGLQEVCVREMSFRLEELGMRRAKKLSVLESKYGMPPIRPERARRFRKAFSRLAKPWTAVELLDGARFVGRANPPISFLFSEFGRKTIWVVCDTPSAVPHSIQGSVYEDCRSASPLDPNPVDCRVG